VFSPTTPTDQASLIKILGFENEHNEDKPGGCPGCADRKDGALISTSTVQTFNLQPSTFNRLCTKSLTRAPTARNIIARGKREARRPWVTNKQPM